MDSDRRNDGIIEIDESRHVSTSPFLRCPCCPFSAKDICENGERRKTLVDLPSPRMLTVPPVLILQAPATATAPATTMDDRSTKGSTFPYCRSLVLIQFGSQPTDIEYRFCTEFHTSAVLLICHHQQQDCTQFLSFFLRRVLLPPGESSEI